MDSRPAKPVIQRPSGDSLPKGSCGLPDRRRTPLSSGGKGLMGSIMIHLGAALVACAFVVIHTGTDGSGSELDSGEGVTFEMSQFSRDSSETQKEAFSASVRKPVAVFPVQNSSIVLPASQPMQLITAQTQALMPSLDASAMANATTTATSGRKKSSSTSDRSGGSGSGKKGKPKPKPPAPTLLKAPPPRYPSQPRVKGITGMTAVLIKVRGDGSAASTAVFKSSGNGELDAAAVEAARKWKFSPTPTLVNGETIPVVVHVTFSI
jgi:TonB family protein